MISNSDRQMTKEESYVERRQLFKNIWDAAMHIEEKEDIMTKPKVIKTLRMDEIDKCPIGKTKKQRIRNLRHVCNRILDFCDRQDADDQFYEQVATDGQAPGKPRLLRKKVKTRVRRKIRKVKSMFAPQNKMVVARFMASERDNPETSTTTKRKKLKSKSTVLKKKSVKMRTSKGVTIHKTDGGFPGETITIRQKILRKKHGKKKQSNASKLGTGPVHIISV